MYRKINKFLRSEDGAITVEWVVITAMVLGVIFGALAVFHQGAMSHAELTGSTLEAQDIPIY